MSRTTLVLCVLAALLAGPSSGASAAVPAWQAGDQLPHALPPAGAHAATAGATTWLIGARPSATTARLARAHGARPMRLSGAYVVPTARARALAAALHRRGLLRWTEPDRRLVRESAFEGNGGEDQWARGVVVAPGLTPPAQLAPIGIVDDVVDRTVADVAQAKVVAKSPIQSLDQEHGPEIAHGTEVASVAAARADGQGVIGIAPGAPLLSYGFKDLSCDEVVNGILDVVDAGAKVVNLSFAVTAADEQDCHAMRLAVASAFGSDAVVVAAAGNELLQGNPIVYPAAYPHVLSVGALDLGLQPAYFSSAGAALDLAAPGEDVPVAVPPRLDLDGNPDGVTRATGTSFAAPIVAGVASWLIGARPKLTAGQYADILRSSAKDVADPGWDDSTGFGLVDLAAALKAPTPPVDRYEPNDGITYVDGTSFSEPDPYIWKGGAAKTVKASVDPVEDPVDVYRIRIPAGRRARVSLTPSSGNADLRVYDGKAKDLTAKALARSSRGAGKTDSVRVTNRRTRARTFYVAVIAPSITSRSFDAPYTLSLRRG